MSDSFDLLSLPAWRLHPDANLETFAVRHIGISAAMSWAEIVGFLSRGVAGDPVKYPNPEIAKRAEGGWTGGLYRDGWRHHSAFVHTRIMTIDIDGHGETERAAAALSGWKKAIHSTYKSTPDAPRCRVVLPLARGCTDLRAYKVAHKAVRERLYAWGYLRPDRERGVKGDLDDGASDATRLNYAPMHHPDRSFAFLATEGELVDIARIPAPPEPKRGEPLATRREPNRDRYREAALRRAEEAVRRALDGQRHEILFREAASLARPELNLSEGEIEAALYAAAVATMGAARAREAQRTIADAIARGRAGT